MERSMRLLAFAVLVAFLGILIWFVPRLDLGAVIAVVLLLAAYDLFTGPAGSDQG